VSANMGFSILLAVLVGVLAACSEQQSPPAPAANTAPAGAPAQPVPLVSSTSDTSGSAPSAAAPVAGGSLGSGGTGLQGSGSPLSGRVSDVEGALRDLGARTVGNEIVVDLPADVLFDFDKYDIRPDAATALGKLLAIVSAQAGGGPVRIEGHTDSIASDAYNQRLSEQRAGSVKSWLAERGVSPARIRTRGFGEARPRAPNARPDGSDEPEGRQQNRRVEVFIRKG
jgi:outer membrane protein OmpA-like peptidoglycan-associated protein